MPDAHCGFPDTEGISGADWLLYYGPTLLVDIGFTPDDKSGGGAHPAPVLQQVHAMVDTGASESCIDESLAEELGLRIVEQTEYATAGGLYQAKMYFAQIHVRDLDHTIYGYFAGVDLAGGGQQHQVLLGREFLRECRMMYDGVTGSVMISKT